MNKKVFIFDMDGVIVNSVDSLYNVYLNFLKGFGIAGNKEEFYLLNGPRIKEIVFYLKKKYRLSEDYESLLKIYKNNIQDIYSRILLIESIEDVLKLLKKKGFKVALASSATKENIDLVLKKFELKQYFDFIVSGDDVKEAKPSPQIYLKVKEYFKDYEYYVFEDSKNGIESASAAGLKVVFFNEQRKDLKQTIKNISFEIKNMEELGEIITTNLSMEEGCTFQKSNNIILKKLQDISNLEAIKNNEEIEKIWKEALMKSNGDLFNGKLLNFVSKNATLDKLEICGRAEEYKNFIAQNKNPYLKLGINPVAVSGMIILNEDGKKYFLFGKRSSSVSTYPEFYELLPSGGMDMKYISGNLIDYKKQLLEEFNEETELSRDHVKNISEFAFIFDQKGTVYDVCCVMDTDLKKEDIMKNFKSKEYKFPLLISEIELGEFLKNNQDIIVPTSKAFLQAFIRKESSS